MIVCFQTFPGDLALRELLSKRPTPDRGKGPETPPETERARDSLSVEFPASLSAR